MRWCEVLRYKTSQYDIRTHEFWSIDLIMMGVRLATGDSGLHVNVATLAKQLF